MKEELTPWRTPWLHKLITSCIQPPDPEALQRATHTPQELRFARRVNALDTILTGRPLLAGNDVKLLIDGPATHEAQLAAIAQARHHVHINVYILTDDSVGRRYLEALKERAAAGIKVRMMFDAYGSRGAGADYREQLRETGIETHAFGPVNPFSRWHWRLSRRQHRKILVVDGRVAFTGGINISDQYSVPPGASQSRPGWRDTNVRIEGPAAAEFQRMFFKSWETEHGPIPPSPAYWPEIEPAGDDLVRALGRTGEELSDAALGPLDPEHDRRAKRSSTAYAIYASYLAAMSEARERIWITQAYFIPNPQFVQELHDAAARGVDVRLLLPGYTDIGLMRHAAHYYYDDLLRAGIRIYEYQMSRTVLHAKTAVIDGVWSTVGSSNLDYRSIIHNDEANAIIISHDFAADMERMFREDLSRSKEIRLEDWPKRSFGKRFLESFAMMFRYWI